MIFKKSLIFLSSLGVVGGSSTAMYYLVLKKDNSEDSLKKNKSLDNEDIGAEEDFENCLSFFGGSIQNN